MDLIVDANILFAALIKESKTVDLLFADNIHLFTPEFVFSEIEQHMQEILSKTYRSADEFKDFMEILKKRIVIVPFEELLPFLKRAENISPDPDDAAFIAAALKLCCPLWSNDKCLKENQDAVKVYSTAELIDMLKV